MKTKSGFLNQIGLWACGLLILTTIPTTIYAGGKVAAWGDNTWQQTLLPNGLNNVKAIAAGSRHSLALKSDGTVVAWGQTNNGGGHLVPAGLSGVKAIAAGGNWNLALRTDGTVIGWGAYNSDLHVAGLSNVTAIAAGGYHWLALKSDGTLATWSAGAGSYTPTNLPSGLSNVVALAAGSEFSLVLRADGTVIAWGWNDFGQTNVPPGLSNVVNIAAGHFHSLALKADGTVVSWGSVANPAVPAGLSNVVAIAAGGRHSLALKADGTMVGWWTAPSGLPDYGQIAIPPGLANVKAIAAGGEHTLALVFDGPPSIEQQPISTETAPQSNAVFSVTATGQAPLYYQWLFNGVPLVNNLRVSGATTASLTISNAQFTDTGTYRVVVSNAFGSVISTEATLTVVGPPLITQHPADQTVRAGADVFLTAAADGTPPLRYQWHFNGTRIPGATSTTLALGNVQPTNSGHYHLSVTNAYGDTVTHRALLTVTDSPPYLLKIPTNQLAALGGYVRFEAMARGSTPLFYQWRFNGADLPGATNAVLQLTALRYDQAGYYNVEVSNAVGSTNSPKALLNVSQVVLAGAPFAGNTNMPLALSNVIAVAAGGSHVMALKSDGTVRTWLANANYIFGSPYAVTNIPASATNIVSIAAGYDHCVALRSNGTVLAWGGSNAYGVTNVPTGLSNVVGIAAGQNRSYAVKADGTVAFWGLAATVPAGLSNVVAVAAGPLQNLALRRDGTILGWGSGALTNVPAGLSSVIALAAGPTYNIALRRDGTLAIWNGPVLNPPRSFPSSSNAVAVASGSNAMLLLRADGGLESYGFEKSPFATTNAIAAIAAGGVQSGFGVALLGSGAPAMTLQPVSQVVQKSNTVWLHARAAGVQPMRYQWLRDNFTVPGATNASLTLSNVLGKDTGEYRLVVSNALGVALSRGATISIPFNTNLAAALNATNLQWVNPDRSMPWFAQNRETHDGDAAGQSGATTNGGSSSLQTYVLTPGTLTFWWKVSSEEGFDFLRVYVDQSPTPLFTISGETDWEQKTIAFTNAGQHTVRWTYTKDGSVSAGRDAGWLDEVKFTVPPPVVSITPSNLTVNAGSNVSFFATTLSYGKPISYQWMRADTNLAGATNQTLVLSYVGRAHAGSYSVRASNEGGSVIASNATLTVITPQRLDALRCLPDGCVTLLARDFTGGGLLPPQLPAFEAQASSNLLNWDSLPGALSLTNGALRLLDTNAARYPQRFYRIVEH